MPFDSSNFEKPPAEVDEVGAIILKARALLSDPAKWTQLGPDCNSQAYCIYTALDNSRFREYQQALKRVMNEIGQGQSLNAIFSFNDDPNTTHADVLALLDRAALAAPNT